MIRIRRPQQPPAILRSTGLKRRRSHATAYARSPGRYRSGTRLFAFDRDIYAHPSVKEALVQAQHDKCCFCESKVRHVAEGDVEHFRPKAGWRQADGDTLERPGYYWLAYEWTNLLFACELCNRRHKRNAFPLRDPSRRARSHRDWIEDEEPLFIDPAGAEDPERLISFHEEVAFAIDDNDAGRTTIDALGLNREALTERRRTWYETLHSLYRLLHALAPAKRQRLREEIADAERLLRRAVDEDAEYAAMARAALAAWQKKRSRKR